MAYNLHNTILCRLCAEPDSNGTNLEVVDPEGRTLRELINKHLPLKVDEDDKFPRTVCQDCHLQVQNLVTFFALLVKGQNLLHRLSKQAPSYQNVLSLYDPDHSIRAEFIPDFAANDLVPKRKRGRPRKDPTVADVEAAAAPVDALATAATEAQMSPQPERVEEELPSDGKRRRKKPVRFEEVIQGKELERVFRENGVLEEPDDDEDSSLQGVSEVFGEIQNSKRETVGVMEAVDTAGENLRKRFQFRCGTCQAAFTQESRFMDHIAIHGVGQERPNGGESSEDFIGHLQATGHFAETVAEPGVPPTPEITNGQATPEASAQFKCSICSKDFKDAVGLKNHLDGGHGDETGCFECEECGKRLKHLSSLHHHKMTRHGKSGMIFVCLKCNQTFRHRRLLQKHQIVHSTDTTVFPCQVCGKAFKSKSQRNLHLQFHNNGKKQSCMMCSQTYSNRTNLLAHMRTHSGEKQFECGVCKKSFTQKGNLQEHLRTHTGEKPFKCEICKKSFTTYSQRRLHVKRHLDDKEFKCESCGKDFLYKESLTIHMRRHNGEKPYKCEKCHKTFAERSSAIKHVRTHTGERPFECNVCGKTFSDSSNLGKHRKTHKTNKDLLVDGDLDVGDLALIEGSNDKQFWAVVKQEDGNDGESQQVIYITYNDPDDPNSKVSEALLVARDGVLEAGTDNASGKMLEVAPEVISDSGVEQLIDPPAEDSAVAADEPVLDPPRETQIVMDEQGQPLRFTTADGSLVQVTTVDGESFQLTTSDGTSVPIILRITSDGQMLTTSRVDMPSTVGDVSDNPITTAVVDSLELVSPSDDRLLSETTLNLLA